MRRAARATGTARSTSAALRPRATSTCSCWGWAAQATLASMSAGSSASAQPRALLGAEPGKECRPFFCVALHATRAMRRRAGHAQAPGRQRGAHTRARAWAARSRGCARRSSRASRTRRVLLDAPTRVDAAGDFFGEEHVPRHALSMGVATILRARRPARQRMASAAMRLGVRLPAARMGWGRCCARSCLVPSWLTRGRAYRRPSV